MMELLFDVQIGGIFEFFVREIDSARIALSCHFALDLLCDKARTHHSAQRITGHHFPLTMSFFFKKGMSNLINRVLMQGKEPTTCGANDDIAACVVLYVPSPCFPAFGRQVALFTVGIFLFEGVAQASVGVRVTRTLTNVIRSLRLGCTSNC